MLINKNIICVSSSAWDTKYIQNIVQIVSLLAEQNKVLYVDYAFTWLDVVKYLFKKNHMPFLNILGFKNRIRTVTTEYNTQLYVLSPPPVLPVNWINNQRLFDYLSKFNYSITLRAIKKAQQKLELSVPYVINSWNPFFGINYRGELKERLHVYHCYDEISASRWMKKHGTRLEKAYLPFPELVITTSKELKNTKSKFNANCYVIPNGVNFDLFHGELNKEHYSSSIDRNGFDNVVGYLGTIDDRIDFDLMEYAITQMPDYLFVFVGRVLVSDQESKLRKFANVLFVPPLKPVVLPRYVYDFSVCIIPFIKNDFTRSVYPIKINEYLAMGKPVVLTDFSDLEEFSETCTIVKTKEEFIIALEVAVTNDTTEKKLKRIEVASENSWRKRAEAFSEILSQS